MSKADKKEIRKIIANLKREGGKLKEQAEKIGENNYDVHIERARQNLRDTVSDLETIVNG